MKKNIFLIFLFCCLVFAAGCLIYVPYHEEGALPPEEAGYGDYSSGLDVSYFYDYLSPYGLWVNLPEYGHVWIPQKTRYGWRPYTYGQWVWTDYGWTWVSHFEWGWAPFHYGRWGWDMLLGWFWKPGSTWGPSWVTWRRGRTYIGWAPLPPEVDFRVGYGIRSLPHNLIDYYWVFVDGPYFLNKRLYRYVLPIERNMTIIRYTVIKTDIVVHNNRVVNRGIDRDEVRKISKHSITKYELQDRDGPGQSRIRAGEIETFKQSLQENSLAKPETVFNREEARVKISGTRLRNIDTDNQKIQLKQIQDDEVKLLEESQEKEMVEIKKMRDEEKKKVKSASKRIEVEKEYSQKMGKLKESHKAEISRIKKRHKKEDESVNKKKIKK